MSMDFFRRPVLAGNNLKRLPFATVYGSVRRLNADAGSDQPYFAGVSATQTLLLKVNGGSVITATLSGAKVNQVLADVNTALGSAGKAFDAGGCLGLQSNTQGASGSIEVTGGTAAKALGFDVSLGKVISYGGDLYGAPPEDTGSSHGVAFPTRGDGLTADVLQRGMGRLAANADVLFADLRRENGLLKPVMNGSSVATISGVGSVFALPASARIFTWFSSGSMTPADLSAYFVLMDSTTHRPSVHRVTAVTDAGATNLLANNKQKGGPVAITTITAGRVVKCSGASFGTSTYGVVGDTVEISGATNLNPWSNNGYRWVIERIIDSQTVELRPMSQIELKELNPTLSDSQPVVELNGAVGGSESYGNLTVRSGRFNTDVRITVSPPLIAGMTYEVWAAQPASARETASVSFAQSMEPMIRELRGQENSLPNAILSGFDVSIDSTNLIVSPGYVRIHGRAAYFPGWSVARGTIPSSKSYIVFDTGTFSVSMGTSAAAFTGTDGWYQNTPTQNQKLLLATTSQPSPGSFLLSPAQRRSTGETVQVTVGVGGQFQTLAAAIEWIHAFADVETTRGEEGAFPHFDIVLVSNVATYGGADQAGIKVPYLRVRGADASIHLTCSGAATPFAIDPGTGACTLVLEDLVLSFPDDVSTIVDINSGDGSVFFKRLRFDETSTGSPITLIQATSGAGTDFTIEDSSLTFQKHLISSNLPGDAGGGCGRIRLSNSAFKAVAPDDLTTNYSIISPGGADYGSFAHGGLLVENCQFIDIQNISSSPALIEEDSTAGFTFITSSRFTSLDPSLIDPDVSPPLSLLMRLSGDSYIFGNIIDGFASAIDAPEACVESNTIQNCNRDDGTSTLVVRAQVANNNIVVSMNGTTHAGVAVNVTQAANGNNIYGSFRKGIEVDGLNGETIIGNSITLWSSFAIVRVGIDATTSWSGSEAGPTISDNRVSMPIGSATSAAISCASLRSRVSGNSIFIDSPNISGILGQNSSNNGSGVIEGNVIFGGSNQATGYSGSAKGLSVSGGHWIISNNFISDPFWVNLDGSGGILAVSNNLLGLGDGSSHLDLHVGNYDVSFSNNHVGIGVPATSGLGTSGRLLISGNKFNALPVSLQVCAEVVGNYFGDNVSIGYGGRFVDNDVQGALSIPSGTGSSTLLVQGNTIGNGWQIASSASDTLVFKDNIVYGLRTGLDSALNGSSVVYMDGNQFLTSSGSLNINSSALRTFSNNIVNQTNVSLGASNPPLVISGCRFNGSGTTTLTTVVVTGCYFVGAITLPGDAEITGTRAQGTVQVTGTGLIQISGCYLNGTFSIASGTGGAIQLTSCHIGGNFLAVSGLQDAIYLVECRAPLSSGTSTIVASRVFVSNSKFDHAVVLGSSSSTAIEVSQSVFSKGLSTSSSGSTDVWLDSSTVTGTTNFAQVGSATITGCRFTKNYVLSTGDKTAALSFAANSTDLKLSNNTFKLTWTGTESVDVLSFDSNYSNAISFGAGCYRVQLLGNTIYLPGKAYNESDKQFIWNYVDFADTLSRDVLFSANQLFSVATISIGNPSRSDYAPDYSLLTSDAQHGPNYTTAYRGGSIYVSHSDQGLFDTVGSNGFVNPETGTTNSTPLRFYNSNF
jgi:hypothetical protein